MSDFDLTAPLAERLTAIKSLMVEGPDFAVTKERPLRLVMTEDYKVAFKHSLMKDPSNRYADPGAIAKMYRDAWGIDPSADPRHIEPHHIMSSLLEMKKMAEAAERSQHLLFDTPRDFVIHCRDKWGYILTDEDTWIVYDADSRPHDVSRVLLESRLLEETITYNHSIPKGDDDRLVVPAVKAEAIKAVLTNLNAELLRKRTAELRNLLSYRDTGKDPREFVKGLLTTYFIDPTGPNIQMFLHLIYSIKRMIFNKNVPLRVFFSFQSKQQKMGKTWLLSQLLSMAPWAYSGEGYLDTMMNDLNMRSMCRNKFLIDFQELAVSKHRKSEHDKLDASVVAKWKAAVTALYWVSRDMYNMMNGKEANRALFATSTNIHFYDLIQDGEMRRAFEFNLVPPTYDQKPDFAVANSYLDNIVELYQMVDESDDEGFYFEGKPFYNEVVAIQKSYAKQDTVSLFMEAKGWSWATEDEWLAAGGSDTTNTAVTRKEFSRYHQEFVGWRKTRLEREMGLGYLQGLLDSNHGITVTKTQRRTYIFYKTSAPIASVQIEGGLLA